MRRLFSVSLLAAMAALLVLSLSGCGAKRASGEALKPKVAPPSIATAGTLRVGVDPSDPPFAGRIAGQTVGLDVDVAAALAERLGLKLKLVEVKQEDIGEALRTKRIDLALGGLPITSDAISDAAFAGSYAVDGPAFFSSVAGTMSVDTLGSRRVGAQEGSLAMWRLDEDLGPGTVKTYKSLRDAFKALQDGKIDVVAGDAIVGAYIARDFDGVHFAGQVRPATPLAVSVGENDTQLESIVRDSLDGMAAQGVLSAICTKWTGDLPDLSTDTSSSSQ